MAAHIILRPKTGKFDRDFVAEELRKIPVLEAEDKPFSFSAVKIRHPEVTKFRRADTADESHPAHDSPLFEISESEILCGVNWTDGHGHVRHFILWILDHYDCEGEDHDGYDYDSRKDFLKWLDVWVPEN